MHKDQQGKICGFTHKIAIFEVEHYYCQTLCKNIIVN